MTTQQTASVTTYKKRRMPKGWGSKLVQYAINLVLVFVFIFPILFMIMSSFKPNAQIFVCLLYTSPSPRD